MEVQVLNNIDNDNNKTVIRIMYKQYVTISWVQKQVYFRWEIIFGIEMREYWSYFGHMKDNYDQSHDIYS